MKLSDYRIRTGQTLNELEREIKALVNGGYIPIGDIGHYIDKYGSRIFFQAMIKER